MAKKVNAKEIAKDINDGLHRTALMVKYEISPTQLDTIIQKLTEKGLLTRSNEISGNRNPEKDSSVLSGSSCPQCGFLQSNESRECSRCGFVFGKQSKPTIAPPPIEPTPSKYAMQAEVHDPDIEALETEAVQERVKRFNTGVIAIFAGISVLTLLLMAAGPTNPFTKFCIALYAVYIVFYHIVILVYAFQTSVGWGIFVLLCTPADLIFFFMHYHEKFKQKLLPIGWLACTASVIILKVFWGDKSILWRGF